MGARYSVAKLYDESGQVASQFTNDEFYSFCDSWEHAMEDEKFVEIIDTELRAEGYANGPLDGLAAFAPSDRVRRFFLAWLAFIDEELEPWTTGGAIHFRPHWARVLMNALVIGDAMGLPDADLRAVAMAAVFHDSRRKSPYLDTGHGARAAAYYADACQSAAQWDAGVGTAPLPKGAAAANEGAFADLVYDPRAMLAIAWHDRDDEEGFEAIAQAVANDAAPGTSGRTFTESLPQGAQADAATIFRIFKDSDGLDRVRLGEGGLDVRFLRTDQARSQVQFAQDLFATSTALG